MAVGFPLKVTYANGDVYSASDVNDTNGTLNLIKPTAKGDLFAGSAANTYTKLAVGTNGQILTADSTTATGLAWSTSSSAQSFTLLNSGGTALTGATTVTVSGLTNQQALWVSVTGASSVNANAYIGIRINTDTGLNYYYNGFRHGISTAGYTIQDVTNDSILLGQNSGADDTLSGSVFLPGTKG